MTLNQFKILLNKINLNCLLLNSFSLNGIQLHKVNELFISTLDEIINLFNSIQQYTMQLATMAEFTHIELIIT